MSVPSAGYLGVCLLLFLLGTVAGRFLNRCVLRLCQHFEVVPAWRHVFEKEVRRGIYPATRWYHCLPVIGTACIVGRSPYSGRRILSREPWLELLNGGLVVLTFVCLCPPVEWGGYAAASIATETDPFALYDWGVPSSLFLWGRFLYFLVLVEALFVATFIDFDLWIIPDGVTVPAMVVGLVGQILGVGFFLAPVWLQNPELLRGLEQELPWLSYWPVENWVMLWTLDHPYLHATAVALAGFVVGGGIVWVVRIVGGVILRREAMGFGDVILMAMVGLFIGWQASILVFFLAPVMAILVLVCTSLLRFLSLVRLPPALPYGPYLSLATLVVLFGWNVIWPAMLPLFLLGPLLFVLAVMMVVVLVVALGFIQLIKRMLGVTDWLEELPVWSSGDQLHYQAGENHDARHGSWKLPRWTGISASQGQLHEHHWRNRCP